MSETTVKIITFIIFFFIVVPTIFYVMDKITNYVAYFFKKKKSLAAWKKIQEDPTLIDRMFFERSPDTFVKTEVIWLENSVMVKPIYKTTIFGKLFEGSVEEYNRLPSKKWIDFNWKTAEDIFESTDFWIKEKTKKQSIDEKFDVLKSEKWIERK